MEFTVKRNEWDRGEGALGRLSGPQGKCCLGFLATACGYTDLGEHPDPEELVRDTEVDLWPAGLVEERHHCDSCGYVTTNTEACAAIIRINDGALPESKRESELTKQFADLGITVHFVD